MARMGNSRGNLCVTPGRRKSLVGERRIVVRVDQEVRDPRMLRILLIELFEQTQPT
jgi:hypothetical protein